VVTAFWSVGLAYAVHPALPYNPVKLPFAESIRTVVWAPQGWSFFTRDAREARVLVLQQVDGRWRSALRGPNARVANVFGFDRAPRAEGTEMAMLTQAVPPGRWRECEEGIERCLAKGESAIAVRLPVPHPLICGDVVLVVQQPVPWAWLSMPQKVDMPIRSARVSVSC
jgi:antimicrobial peptide system SdpA family protein